MQTITAVKWPYCLMKNGHNFCEINIVTRTECTRDKKPQNFPECTSVYLEMNGDSICDYCALHAKFRPTGPILRPKLKPSRYFTRPGLGLPGPPKHHIGITFDCRAQCGADRRWPYLTTQSARSSAAGVTGQN